MDKTDAEGRVTAYAYDALNRLTSVTDADANETIYTYDNRDNLISLTDAEGRTTRFAYDRNNRLVKEIRPMGEETTYEYDCAGNLIEKIDAKNQRSAYLYDDAGRLSEIRYYASGDPVNAVKTVTFGYDKAGNLTGYDDGATSAVYTYDDNYRKTAETVQYPGFGLSLAYTYYKNGLKKTFTGPDGIVYGFLYDSNNQLTGIQIPDVGMFTVNEYKWNRPATETLPGGAQRLYSYDELMRTAGISAKDPGGHDQLNYAYTYDKVDNITAKVTEHGDYGYTYDDLYRLTDADNPDGQADESFTYDGVGNRLTAADTAGDWGYNANNELEGFDTTAFQYDANGNMIEKSVGGAVTRFFYNLEDRLERVEDGSGGVIAEYYYDPFGRRLWKDVGGTRTCFFYSDEGLAGEFDGAGAEIKTYGWKPESTWSTDPLFMKVGTEYYWYHNDQLGTPQVMTTSSGAVVWSTKYSSFLEANVHASSTITNNLRASGQYFDDEIGLQYNRYRYYDPKIGRYLTIDPVGISGGDPNLYSYVFNSPTYWIDPLGLSALDRAYKWIEDGAPDRNDLYAYESFLKYVTLLEYEGIDIDSLSDYELDLLYFEAQKHYDAVTGALALGLCLRGLVGRAKTILNNTPKRPKITKPYRRPSGATTKAQRKSVQGKPCVDCGAGGKKYADHKKPLVKEYYETGKIDETRMRDLDAVQPQCPTCSNRQGGKLRKYSIEQRKKHGL